MTVGLRLFLPESWTDDLERMARAHVPKDKQIALTKPEIALEEIDRVIASDARFGCVLADAGYGSRGHRPVATRWSWSTMVTCTPATIMLSRSTSWATSGEHR